MSAWQVVVMPVKSLTIGTLVYYVAGASLYYTSRSARFGANVKCAKVVELGHGIVKLSNGIALHEFDVFDTKREAAKEALAYLALKVGRL